MANINAQVDNIKKARKIVDYAKIENDEINPVQDWDGFSTETLWFILSGNQPEEDNETPSGDDPDPLNDNINSSENDNENSTSSEENNNLNPFNDNEDNNSESINEGE